MLATQTFSKGDSVAMDFRKQITERLKKLGMTKYRLSVLLKGKPSRNALYTYMREEGADMEGKNLARIIDVLDAEEKRQQKGKN